MKPFLFLIIAIPLILISTKSWSNDGNGFNHPGLFHSQNDLDRMREAVKAAEDAGYPRTEANKNIQWGSQ